MVLGVDEISPCPCALCREELDDDTVASIISASEATGEVMTADEFRAWLDQLSSAQPLNR